MIPKLFRGEEFCKLSHDGNLSPIGGKKPLYTIKLDGEIWRIAGTI